MCIGALVYWCIGVLVHWCIGVLVYWCIGRSARYDLRSYTEPKRRAPARPVSVPDRMFAPGRSPAPRTVYGHTCPPKHGGGGGRNEHLNYSLNNFVQVLISTHLHASPHIPTHLCISTHLHPFLLHFKVFPRIPAYFPQKPHTAPIPTFHNNWLKAGTSLSSNSCPLARRPAHSALSSRSNSREGVFTLGISLSVWLIRYR